MQSLHEVVHLRQHVCVGHFRTQTKFLQSLCVTNADALDQLPDYHILVAELAEVVWHVEGTIALVHQGLGLLDVLQLLLEIYLGVDYRLRIGQCLQVDLVGIFFNIVLLEVIHHEFFHFVDEPDIVLCLDFGGGKQHLHHCLSIILQQHCLVGLREESHTQRLSLEPIKDVFCVLLVDGSQGRLDFGIGGPFQADF